MTLPTERCDHQGCNVPASRTDDEGRRSCGNHDSDRPRCSRCGKAGEVAVEHYDRHGIYSGKGCGSCYKTLPGQGRMWNYEPEHGESIDEDY
jgi:hypothetical protein